MRAHYLSTSPQELVLHFETKEPSLRASTLAGVLAGLAESVAVANERVNLGHTARLQVVALEPGSFRVTLEVCHQSRFNLFSSNDVRAVVLSIIAAAIYEFACAPRPDQLVRLEDGAVSIQTSEVQVVIPAETAQILCDLEAEPRFASGIHQTMGAIAEDPDVEALRLEEDVPSPEDQPPDIPRSSIIAAIADRESDWEPRSRYVEATLRIVKAVLESGRRKWEFVWMGKSISAPISDATFHQRFEAHVVTIAPGDVLEVEMRIDERVNSRTGESVIRKYDVLRVLKHVPVKYT